MDINSIKNHIRKLTNQHTGLESVLNEKTKGHSWSEIEVENLKKQKLKIKDELVQMYQKKHELESEIEMSDR